MNNVSVTIAALAFLGLVWAGLKIGWIKTLLIGIAANIVGFMTPLSEVAVASIQAIGDVAQTLGS
jgi:hypothetical protein